MDRRTYLAMTAAAAAGLAGCSSAEDAPGDPNPGTPKPVTLSSEDATAEDPYASLEVAYAATVSDEIPTDPATLANEGTKWLFVRMRIANTGDSTHEITGGPFVVRAGGERHEIVSSNQDWELRGRRLEAGASTTGWMVFQLPRSTTSATLTIRDDISRGYAVTFEQDSSLNTTLP